MRRATYALLLVGLATWTAPMTRPACADPTVEAFLARGTTHLVQAEQLRRRGAQREAATLAREAEQWFRAALEHQPDLAQAALLGTQAAVFAEDLGGARTWLERYRQLTPGGERDGQFLLLSAMIALELEDRPDRALGFLRRMQAIEPRTSPVQRDLLMYQALDTHAVRYAFDKGYEEAARLYRAAQVVSRRLGHVRKLLAARVNEAIMLQRASRHGEAQVIYEALRREDPQNPAWLLSVAVCLGDQNRFEEAIPLYRQVVAMPRQGGLPPDQAREFDRAWLRLGNCYRLAAPRAADAELRRRLLGQAREAIETYVAKQPDDHLGYRWLGKLLFQDFEEPYAAKPLLEKAWELEPLCADPLRELIQIHTLYPPPGENPDAEALARWKQPLEEWQRELDQGKERRKMALDARRRETGVEGCD